MSKHVLALMLGMVTCGTAFVASAGAAGPGSTQAASVREVPNPFAVPAPEARKNLFRDLFKAPSRKGPSAQHPQSERRTPPAQKGRVVCGMLVMPTDPDLDPGIRIQIPDSAKNSKVRVVEPPACFRMQP